ncbi:CHASE2 domain-containing protein [Pseudomonas nitroreducens]|uniref:CHASE2 domain-containing protein n=1 Tax=Pseudomonas nitroreducens TaxID=46680 RepID=UPI00380850B5
MPSIFPKEWLSLRLFMAWLMRWAMYVLLGYWALQSDPFGFSAATDKALATQISRLVSYLFPEPVAAVTVVAIDYPSIDGLHNGGRGWMTANDWPLTYADHRRILRDLSAPRGEPAPAAIFYDIFFERPRVISGDLEPLGRQLQRLRNDPGMPRVFLAGGGSFVPMSEAAFAALQHPALAVSAWDGMGDFYPLHASLGTAAAPQASAATALYRTLCTAAGKDCRWADEEGLDNLAVQWRVRTDSACDGFWRNLGRDLWSGVGRVVGFATEDTAFEAACMPIHQVRLSELYGEHPASLRPPGLAPGEPYAVLVGVVMPSLRDYVPSPLYGQVAGVYLHANALENLLRKDEDYLRERNLKWWSVAAVALTIALCMLGGIRRHARRPLGWLFPEVDEHAALHRRLLTTLLFGLVFSSIVLLLYGLCQWFGHATPEGWLSLIGLMPFLREVVLAGEKKYSESEKVSNEARDCDDRPAAGGIEPGVGAG